MWLIIDSLGIIISIEMYGLMVNYIDFQGIGLKLHNNTLSIFCEINDVPGLGLGLGKIDLAHGRNRYNAWADQVLPMGKTSTMLRPHNPSRHNASSTRPS